MGLGEAQSWDFRIENAVWMWYSGIAIPVSATQHFYGLLEQSNEYSVRFMPVNVKQAIGLRDGSGLTQLTLVIAS